MCAATARTENKYAIPRNSLIPEQSALDVLMSAPLYKAPTGGAQGFSVPLFRASGEADAQFSMQKQGALYYFQYGQIYIYDAARTVAMQAFEGASLAAAFMLPGVADLAGGFSELVAKGGDLLLDAAREKISAGKPRPRATVAEQVALLESQGMVVLRGVDLVGIEYQVEPAGFLSKERHRQIFTFENSAHEVNRYQLGAPSKGKASPMAESVINAPLIARKYGELGTLVRMVMKEFAAGFDAIQAEMQSTFEQQHGAGTAYRSAEFVKELNQRYEAEVQRNGYNTKVFAQRSLELLEPMREIYDTTPVLQGMMQELRALAAGQA